jgi:hypothetical protein
MSTPLTVEMLMDIVRECSTTITTSESGGPEWMATSETVEVIDAKHFQKALQELLDGRHSVVFANLVGKSIEEAAAFLEARSPYEREQHPAHDLVSAAKYVRVLFVVDRRTLAERTPVLIRYDSDNVITEVVDQSI